MTKVVREAIGAAQRVLDPMFEEYGGKRRFKDVRRRMVRKMVEGGTLTSEEIARASRRKPMKDEQEARDWAYRERAGGWFPPGEPEWG